MTGCKVLGLQENDGFAVPLWDYVAYSGYHISIR